MSAVSAPMAQCSMDFGSVPAVSLGPSVPEDGHRPSKLDKDSWFVCSIVILLVVSRDLVSLCLFKGGCMVGRVDTSVVDDSLQLWASCR